MILRTFNLIPAALILLLAPTLVLGTSNIAYAQTANRELKILSWNVQLLPMILFPHLKNTARSKAIGKKLAELDQWDVLVFQEAFDHAPYGYIKRILKSKYPNQFGPANRRFVTLRVGSGVMILSKLPTKHLENIIFKNFDGLDNSMSRKGAMLVEVEKDGQKFQILGTHLNAGGDPYIRLQQVLSIRSLLDRHQKNDVPIIAAGDFNISRDTELYQRAMYNLRLMDGPFVGPWQNTVDWEVNDYYRIYNGGKSKQVIDYQFVDPKGLNLVTERLIPDLRSAGWNKTMPGIENMSDHLPVQLKINY